MKRGESPPEPALRPEINLLFVLPRAPDGHRAAPRRGQGQEPFVPTVQVKVRPGGCSQHIVNVVIRDTYLLFQCEIFQILISKLISN